MIMIMMIIIHKLRKMISKLRGDIELVRKSLPFNCWIIWRRRLIIMSGEHSFSLLIRAGAIVLIRVILIKISIWFLLVLLK